MNATQDALQHLASLTRSDLDAATARPTHGPQPQAANAAPSAIESLDMIDAAARAQREIARDPVNVAKASFQDELRYAAQVLEQVNLFDQEHGAEVRELDGRFFLQNAYRIAGAPESLLIRLDRNSRELGRRLAYAKTKLRGLPDRVAKLTAVDVRNKVHEVIRQEMSGYFTAPSVESLAMIRKDLATLAEIVAQAALGPPRREVLPMPKAPLPRPDQALTAYDVLNPAPNQARR